jgi:REDY-like protein HapK
VSAPACEGEVFAVNMFSLLPGVDAQDFDRFSTEIDQPTCLAFGDIVKSFDAYRVTVAPDGAPADIVEVMHVTDWAAWEQVRDNDPAFRPVMDGFNTLVDVTTVRTWFTQAILGGTQ